MQKMKKCPNCNTYVDNSARYCTHCGYNFESTYNQTPPPVYERDNAFDSCVPGGPSRGVAAILAIFLGYLGVQYFYLGLNKAGVISLILGLVSCGLWSVVTFIQGILMLCMTNAQFTTKFVNVPRSAFPVF